MATEASTGVVIRAFAANLVIAVAKFLAFLFGGSASMLAETFHSTADTFNQALLYLGIRLQRSPPDEEHPFGHGRERFFWSFVVAVSLFVIGGALSIYEGIHKLSSPVLPDALLWTYGALAIGFLFDGWVFFKALGHMREEAREDGVSIWRFLHTTKDPSTLVVLLEDAAASIGVLLAAAGVTLAHLTGNAMWDGVGSIAIGVLLIAVAGMLAYETRSLLLGEAATPAERQDIRDVIRGSAYVREVAELLTAHLGPDEILVTGYIVLNGDMAIDEAARELRQIEDRVRDEVPDVTFIFLSICEPDVCPPPHKHGRTAERHSA